MASLETKSATSEPAPASDMPASDVPTELSEEEKKAAKRKEIEAKLAALKLQQQKEQEQKTMFFGEHPGITCDGCGVGPIVGYRYRCKQCANHDVCESCYDAWSGGKMQNGLGKQVLSTNAADHTFSLHKDKGFKSLVKGSAQATTKVKQLGPNDPCSCASGKKFKKCCGKP